MKISYKGPMMSLFDYRGVPDREGLGKKVFAFSKYKNVKTSTRILPKNYPFRTVMMYPKGLLDEYFHTRELVNNLKKFF